MTQTTDTIEIHAASTEATYPNALNGPWVTTVESFHHKSVSGEGTRYRVVARQLTDMNAYPKYLGMISDDLESALALLAAQEQKVRESGVTADTPRLGHCSCGSNVPPSKFLMWTTEPFRQFEDNYDGCRGWD